MRRLWVAVAWLPIAGAVCLNGHPSVAKEYASAKAVMVAEVLAERQMPDAEPDFIRGTMYTIRVERLFRGSAAERSEIFSENSSGRFPMRVGSKYLLFLHEQEGQLVVDYCGNSGLAAERGKQLREVVRLAAGK